MKLLIAKRTMKYATRRLSAGDTFEAKDRDANVLTRIGRAEYAPIERKPAKLPPMPESLRDRAMAGKVRDPDGKPPSEAAPRDPLDQDGDGHKGGSPKPEPSEDLSDLRARYTEATGKRPFGGWGADMLRAKIADAS
jgi:hypothetical protein